MTPSEQEEVLRRALHAVADTIEPAADGLERIRERLSKPRPLAVAWLMAGWTGLAQPALLRMEPVLAELAGQLSERLGVRLRPGIRSLGATTERLRPAIERLLAAIGLLRPGSGMSRHRKLRLAIAIGAAALIGTVSGLALSDGLPQHLISEANSIFWPSQSSNVHGDGHNTGRTGGSGPSLRRHQAPTRRPGSGHHRPRLRHRHRRP